MRIESSCPSQRELVGSNTDSIPTSRASNTATDTIDNKQATKSAADFLAAIAIFFAVGCAFLFLIADAIREWIKMRK